MLTLGLDTTGAYCTAALVDGPNILGELSEKIGRGHAERLAPMVRDVLAEADIKPVQIARVAVCTGPGSFTGLRVAIAFAKGFALPRNIPVVGISALEILAAQADPGQSRHVIPVMDVRRNQLCWSAYRNGVETHPPKTESVTDAARAITALGADRIIGDGADKVAGQSSHVIHVSGSILAKLAQERAPKAHPPEPLYSRPPDAKLPGGVIPNFTRSMMPDIRELADGDAGQMATLHSLCFDVSWPEADMAGHVGRDIVLGAGSPLKAMILVRVALDQAEILTLATHPDHRGMGLGACLLKVAEERALAQGADIMFLEVAEDNSPAIALYKKCAYEVFGRRLAYYRRKQGRVGALMFRKKLDGSTAKG